MKKIFKTKNLVMLAMLTLVSLLLMACGNQGETSKLANKVLQSNVIYTVASEEPISGGVAICDNKILAVGTMEELKPYMAKDAEIIDLGEQMIMPGFVDAHTHSTASETVLGVDVTFVESQKLCGEAVAKYIEENPDAKFVIGGGWYAAVWGGEEPNKNYLDAVASDVPVALFDYDHHTLWCNSKALAMAGVDKAYAADFNSKNSGELIVVDASGEPTGYLKEDSMSAVNSIIPQFQTEDLKRCIDVWSEYGVTAINEMSTYKADSAYFNQIEELVANNQLQVRHILCADSAETPENLQALQKRFTGDVARFANTKTFLDGVGASFTASMLKPYLGTDNCGPAPYYTAEEVAAIVEKSSKLGLASHFHVCGDRAVRVALDGIELAIKNGAIVDERTSLEHLDTIHKDDLNRAAKLGISCNITPDFMAPTPTWDTNAYLAIYDKEVASELWNFGSLYRSGVNVAFSTDAYCSSYNPLVQLYRATQRVMDDGKPVGGYLPEEKLTIQEAIKCYTLNSAKSLGMSDKIGTLEAGKYADIVVLDNNILSCPPEKIAKTNVVMTMMDGRVVYEK